MALQQIHPDEVAELRAIGANEIKHQIHVGFVAGLADKELLAHALWNGNPHESGTPAFSRWNFGYEVGRHMVNVVGGQLQS